jgi:peptide/nickel transport system substrate-binding protein
MNKKILSLILFAFLLISAYVPIAIAHNAPFPGGYDPNVAVVDTIGEPETVDPAWCYDTGSAEVIFNVYETMTFYQNKMSDGPYTAGKFDEFKPMLATEWAWQAGPAPYVKTLYFKVRENVLFHNGATLTPADAEYSWERWMVQDRDGGPQWMIFYPVLNQYYALSPDEDPTYGDQINNAIESNSTHVWIHLATDFPETTFLQIMSQGWASVVNKAWAVGLGDFDGNWAAGWETIYNTWHNPEVSHIEDAMMGTGPYKFDYWVHGTSWSIIKNDAYWDGWPARVERQPAATNERIGGFLTRIVWNLLTSWTTRRARFTAGDADFTYVPRQYRGQVLGQIVGGEPIRCFFPVTPSIAVDANFFTFDVNPQSPYLGPGFNPATPNVIAEDRIPANLFSDVHMRAAFTAAFDYNTFLAAAYLGEAEAPADPIIPGLSYDNVANAKPTFDMAKVEAELQLAHGGAIWANGMTFTLLYNEGNIPRETAVTMLTNNINGLNPLFHLNTQPVAWGSTYLPQMVAGMLPLFSIGWLVDYPDADNFAFPFMHTYGTFSAWQGYSNSRVDDLIEAGALMPEDSAAYAGELDLPDLASLNAAFNNAGGIPPDTRWPRRSIYYEIQAIYRDDVPGFCMSQAIGRPFQLAWTRGWYYNPVYPGGYFYHRWKTVTHFGDANNDGVVGVADGATVSGSWTKPSPTSPLGPAGYRTQADLTGGTGGTDDGGAGLIAGIPDGKVSVVDAAMVSAYWDGPPQGPSHP